MKRLELEVEEFYTKDGKRVSELIQEWMEENNFLFYCKNNKENIEYLCR